METTIYTGDIIYLKSGGPAMTALTVEYKYPYNIWLCYWFCNGELRSSKFEEVLLTKEIPQL